MQYKTNEYYAKDISKKIKSVKRDKQRKGQFIGGKPMYGYKMHPTEKNKIVIDEEVAPIVRRIFALALSGMFASFGGMFMSMSYASRFVRDMMAGRGFIGIAAESMGGGHPFGAAFAAAIFGVADALANVLQSFSIPSELLLMIPYLATIVGLVLYSIRRQEAEKKRIQKMRQSNTVKEG